MLVICINGAINSGKSTVGLAVAQLLAPAEFIEGDAHGAPDGLALDAMIDFAVARLVRLVETGGKEVAVIAYPLRAQDVARLRVAAAARQARLLVVTLAPPIEVALSNRGGRILSEDERTRIRAMYEEGYAQRDFSDLVLTDAESVQDSARRIVSALRSFGP